MKTRHWRAALPVDVYGFHGGKAYVQGAIHGRAGWGKYAANSKWLVCMQAKVRIARAVAQQHPVAQLVVFLCCHFCPKNNIKDTFKLLALRKLQGGMAAILIAGKYVWCCAHHCKALVRITKRHGNGPGHVAALGYALGAVPAHVVGGLAHVENGIQQQLQLAAARAHYQISARNCLYKIFAHLGAHAFHAQQQGGGKRDGKDHKAQRGSTVPCAGQGQC